MKKMKRIEAIIKGRKFTEALFGLRKKQIRRALEAASDNAEKQKEEAALAYEQLFSALGADNPNYQSIINDMIRNKQTIISADATIKAVAEIRADLDAEIVVDDTDIKD